MQVSQGPPAKPSTKPLLLKGKPTRKAGLKSPRATSSELVLPRSNALSVSTVQTDTTGRGSFWDEEEEEEEEEDDEIDFMETGEKVQMPEYLSADDEEENDEEGEESSAKTSTKSRRKRIKYHKQRRKRAQQQKAAEEGQEAMVAEKTQSKETRSSGT